MLPNEQSQKTTAGGLLTKFIKRGLDASQCAAVGRYIEAAKQRSSTAKEGEEGRKEGKMRGRKDERGGVMVNLKENKL